MRCPVLHHVAALSKIVAVSGTERGSGYGAAGGDSGGVGREQRNHEAVVVGVGRGGGASAEPAG
eukprot:1981093-Rhodomonas_salina.2